MLRRRARYGDADSAHLKQDVCCIPPAGTTPGEGATKRREFAMYIGGGVITLIIIILLLVWLF